MSFLKFGIWVLVLLLLLLSFGVIFSEDFRVEAKESNKIAYNLEAINKEGQTILTGTMKIDFKFQTLLYQINDNDTDLSGRIKFEDYREGMAKAVTEFLFSSMTKVQVNLLSTVFLPVHFNIEEIEKKLGAGWYKEDTQTGFSFIEEININEHKAIQGKFIYQGKELAKAAYVEDKEHPVKISWVDNSEITYRAILRNFEE